MVRRIANQVHQQVGRLLRGKYPIKEPAWYNAVLEHPPLPLPARSPPKRTSYDASVNSSPDNPHQRRALSIVYHEDRVRRQFFADHPFEAFRPKTLIETDRVEDVHSVSGKAWTRLRQRGRNPTAEDAVKFAVNLYEHHNVSLSNAYATAVAQFRALRAECHIMNSFAAEEAEAFGAVFGPSPIQAGYDAEAAVISRNKVIKARMDQSDIIARKRWRLAVDGPKDRGEWSKGQEYVRLWREGSRPSYEKALTAPLDTVQDSIAEQKRQVDNLIFSPV